MDFIEHMDGCMIVSDAEGNIIYMNEKEANNLKDEGGRSLIGKNLFDCHKESSNEKIRHILATGEKNIYTIEKKGKKKLIYQAPWYAGDAIGGLVELSLEIPFEMPHFIRD